MSVSDGEIEGGGRLVVGLGNPGTGYRMNRHNAGFMALDALALDLGLKFEPYGRLALVGSGGLGEERFFLVKPLTYMNRSGRAVGDIMDRHDIPLARLFVVSDDFNLPLGRIRIRRQGSDGGHNGLKSILRTLGSGAFPRLRIGVGPLPRGMGVVEYVLGDFGRDDLGRVQRILALASSALRLWLEKGDLELCMNRFNPMAVPETDTESPGR
jgi:PTH1 family peptidyl-tRNA hydrolase